jgi:hypothetical protein
MLNKLSVKKKHFKRLKYLPLIAHSSPRMRGYRYGYPAVFEKEHFDFWWKSAFFDKKMGAFLDYHESKETFLNPHMIDCQLKLGYLKF